MNIGRVIILIALALAAVATQVRAAAAAAAPTVITLGDSSPAGTDRRTREIVAQARALDSMKADWRADKEVIEGLCRQLDAGGPEAQRVIFESWPQLKDRSSGLAMQALASHYADKPVHSGAVPAATNALIYVTGAARDARWNPNSPAHIVLMRLAEHAELMPRVLEDLRRQGCQPEQMTAILRGVGDQAGVVRRLRERIGTRTLSFNVRQDAVRTLTLLGGDEALALLTDLATGADDSVAGAERAPVNGNGKTDEEREFFYRHQLRATAINALANCYYNSQFDAKRAPELERRLVPVFVRIINSYGPHTLRSSAITSLSGMGTAGKLALLELYETETDPYQAHSLCERLVDHTHYPRALLKRFPLGATAEGRAYQAAAVRIMRLGLVATPAQRAAELTRLAEEANDPELRRQAAIALLDRNTQRAVAVPDKTIRRLLGSPHPEVAAAAAGMLSRELQAQLLTPETVRPLLYSGDRAQREIAIRQTFHSARSRPPADVVLPLLASDHADVVLAAARALYDDDTLRRSVGVDTARNIGLALGRPAVEQIVRGNATRGYWIPEPPPAASAAAAGDASSQDTTTSGYGVWLWRITWGSVALFVGAIALVILFAALTVPEPRIAFSTTDQ